MNTIKIRFKHLVRRLSAWAWQDKFDQEYTHDEVAQWLTYYKGRMRDLTLSEWVREKRNGTLPTECTQQDHRFMNCTCGHQIDKEWSDSHGGKCLVCYSQYRIIDL